MAAVWGIDIGKAALKAVKLRRTKEGLEIQAIEYIPYPVEEDEDERQEQSSEAIKTFLAKHKIGHDTVVVGIPGLHAFSRFIKLPPVDRSKIGHMVQLEAQQQIPFPIAEVNWDFHIVDREYEPGEEIEVGIFATRTELIDGFLSDLQESGLIPDIVTIAPLAVFNFVRYNESEEESEQEGATLILDVGSEHTDLVIHDRARFWIRNLRIAGNDVTKALAERFKIPFAEAEKLKRSSSKSQQAKKIFSSMESTLKDLVGEIHRSVGFFKSQVDELDVQRLLLLGDGAKLKNMPKFLQGALKYDVARVQRLEQDKFVLDPNVDLDVLKNHIQSFAVALGLAIQGVKQANCSVNLAPKQLQIQSALRSKLPWAAATAACTWAALGLGYLQASSAKGEIDGALKKVGAISQYSSVQNEAVEARDALPALEQSAKRYLSVGAGRTLMLDLMDQVRQVLPTDNAKIAELTPAEREQLREDVNGQIVLLNKRLDEQKINLGKTWLLDWTVRRLDPAGPGEPSPYKVVIRVAKHNPRSAGKRPDELREEIKRDVASELVKRLKDAPFWLRNSENGRPEYGEINVSTPIDIYALEPSQRIEPMNPFQCVMVTLTFEVGVPKPEPKPADDQGGE